MSQALTIDNRNTDDMLAYYEARIDALVKRVHELENDKAEVIELQFGAGAVRLKPKICTARLGNLMHLSGPRKDVK